MSVDLAEKNKEARSLFSRYKAGRSRLKVEHSITLKCRLDSFSGYGIYTNSLVNKLLDLGVSLNIVPVGVGNREYGNPDYNSRVAACIGTRSDTSWDLFIYPCVIRPIDIDAWVSDDVYMVYSTMWESTRVSKSALQFINRADVLIVPCSWNASCFSAWGVNSPINIVPLGLDTEKWPIIAQDYHGPFTFGTAGCGIGGGSRKGFNLVVSAFKMAFPTEPDVRLHVKCFPVDKVQSDDPRIVIYNQFMQEEDLVDWYSDINVFVSGSSSEGWGLMQHQAMCTGRPVISVYFGGITEFFNQCNGYTVDWVLGKGSGVYSGMGHYAIPDVVSMAKQMRLAFEDSQLFKVKCSLVTDVRKFTIQNSAEKLLKTLTSHNLWK